MLASTLVNTAPQHAKRVSRMHDRLSPDSLPRDHCKKKKGGNLTTHATRGKDDNDQARTDQDSPRRPSQATPRANTSAAQPQRSSSVANPTSAAKDAARSLQVSPRRPSQAVQSDGAVQRERSRPVKTTTNSAAQAAVRADLVSSRRPSQVVPSGTRSRSASISHTANGTARSLSARPRGRPRNNPPASNAQIDGESNVVATMPTRASLRQATTAAVVTTTTASITNTAPDLLKAAVNQQQDELTQTVPRSADRPHGSTGASATDVPARQSLIDTSTSRATRAIARRSAIQEPSNKQSKVTFAHSNHRSSSADNVQSDAVPRGRGRPRKDAGSQGPASSSSVPPRNRHSVPKAELSSLVAMIGSVDDARSTRSKQSSQTAVQPSQADANLLVMQSQPMDETTTSTSGAVDSHTVTRARPRPQVSGTFTSAVTSSTSSTQESRVLRSAASPTPKPYICRKDAKLLPQQSSQPQESRPKRAAAVLANSAIVKKNPEVDEDMEEEKMDEEETGGNRKKRRVNEEEPTDIQSNDANQRMLRTRPAAPAVITQTVPPRARSTRASAAAASEGDAVDEEMNVDMPDTDAQMDSPRQSRASTKSTHRSPTRRSISGNRTDNMTRKRGTDSGTTAVPKPTRSAIQKPPRAQTASYAYTGSTTRRNAQQQGLIAIQRELRPRQKKQSTIVSSSRAAHVATTANRRRKRTRVQEDAGPTVEQDIAMRIFNKHVPVLNMRSGKHWDHTERQLELWRTSAVNRGVQTDFWPENKEKYKSDINKEFKKNKLPMLAGFEKKWFYKCAAIREAPSNFTHPVFPTSGPKSWPRSKEEVWYEEEIKTVCLYIHIGALCEKCTNPFSMDEEYLSRKVCICPKPLAPEWIPIKIDDSDLTAGQTREELHNSLWKKKFNEHLQIVEKELRKKIKKEHSRKYFKDNYPLHRIPLKERKDQFGKDAFQKAKELNTQRMKKNLCPAFIMSWTNKKEGDIGIPNHWIEDQETKYSGESEQLLASQKKPGRSGCRKDCQHHCKSNKCCENTMAFATTYTVNKNQVLVSKIGLFPTGVDGKRTPRMLSEKKCTAVLCDDLCNCSPDSCPSQAIRNGSKKMKVIFHTNERGWSIRTAEKLVRGEYIFSFSGLVMTRAEIEKDEHPQNEDMYFDLTPNTGTDVDSHMTITTCRQCNEFKFINHDCAPNSLICLIYGRKHGHHIHGVSCFARKTIEAYEEVTYDYYTPEAGFRFDCQCGHFACRGLRGL